MSKQGEGVKLFSTFFERLSHPPKGRPFMAFLSQTGLCSIISAAVESAYLSQFWHFLGPSRQGVGADDK